MSENGNVNLALIQPVLEKYRGGGRTQLLPALHEIQGIYRYIPEPAAAALGRALGIPLADVYGVIGFYSLFYDHGPIGETVIRICTGPSCGIAGADRVLDAVCEKLGIEPGQTTPDGKFTVERTTCLGLCEHSPSALITRNGQTYQIGSLSPEAVDELLEGKGQKPTPIVGGEGILLGRIRKGIPATLSDYIREGGYIALRKALSEMTPDDIIEEIKKSGLVGRGGAAFPTGLKWQFTRSAPGEPKYAIANADESEPGTFKDRVLMEADPFALIEGLTICGYAIGAHQGYIFIRGEYPAAEARLRQAVEAAEKEGYLGENILNSGFDFSIEIRRGAGAYICGEETALFEAIEGKRGHPRIKPPYPTTNGLFDKPTTINNVETLCTVPHIVTNGGEWYRQWGTDKSSGTKLFAVSGHVAKPGVYELPLGITLRALIEEHAGGVIGELQAVLMGGAAGVFMTPDQLDTPLTFEDLTKAGAALGSGAVMVFNTTVDLRDILARIGQFFAHESCGKCYPCQLGTQRQKEILERLAAGKPTPGDRQRLLDIGTAMSEASLCGLGLTAASAVLSAIRIWPEMFPE